VTRYGTSLESPNGSVWKSRPCDGHCSRTREAQGRLFHTEPLGDSREVPYRVNGGFVSVDFDTLVDAREGRQLWGPDHDLPIDRELSFASEVVEISNQGPHQDP
jgi:hypothetical protein